MPQIRRIVQRCERQNFCGHESRATELRQFVVKSGPVGHHRSVGSNGDSCSGTIQSTNRLIAELHLPGLFAGGDFAHAEARLKFTERRVEEGAPLNDQRD